MRGGTILALLLVALPLIAVSSDGRPPGTGESAAHGRSLPSVQNQSLEISFEKSEYLEMNLSGNITMNITFTSKKNVDVNVTVSSYFRNSQGDSLAATTSSSLDGIKYIVLAPLEARTLSVNVSVKPFLKDGYFGRMAYIVRASNSNMTSRNYTMIVSWGQYSVKVVEPAPSMGECHVAVGTPITIRLNVTNYSDGILDGILEQDGGRRTVLVGPKSSVMVNITISPFLEATKTMLEFPLSTPNSFSGIGFDMENGHATNVTDPYVTVNAHEPLRILVHKGNLNLSEPGSINISIVSGTNHLQKNLLFSVRISGWLSERISHRGEFTVAMLEPWGMVNLSYKVTSHVAGYFSVEVSTSSTGKKVSMGGGLTVSALAGPSGYMTTNHHGDRALGDREFINGSMTNKYPYTLHDVKLMVLLGNNFRGLLSREDFMEFQPSEMAFSVLESNQTVNFSFNVTLNSAGKWKMTVVALWGGNASWGGDGVLQELQVFRTRFVYSPIGIVITIAVVSVAPKAVDLVIRRIRRIGS